MNHLRILALTLGFVFLTACFGPPVEPEEPRRPRKPISEEELERRKARDDNRRTVFTRSRNKYKYSEVCDDEDRNHECRDICDDIYSNNGDREDCEEDLTVAQIERLEDLYKILKNPKSRDLDDIDFEDFEVYLNVSSDAFARLVNRYSSSRAEDFILWMIENEEVADLIRSEEEDFEILEELLGNLSSFNSATVHEPFLENIDGSDKLMEVAIQEGGEDIMRWFMDFINDKAGQVCDNDEDIGCFKIYCRIGEGLDEESQDHWLRFKEFESYVENVIDRENRSYTESSSIVWCREVGTSSSCMDDDEVTDLDDVNNWVDDLCKGI